MLTTSMKQAVSALLGRNITFNDDGLISFHGADFLADSRFLHAYQEGVARYGGPVNVQWRVRVALWAAEQGLKLEGDFVECGTNTGILAGAVMDYVQWQNIPDRKYFLLDTFEGIPLEGLSESSLATARKNNVVYRDVYETVCEYFSQYPNVVIVRGIIPGTLAQITSEKVAYLSIDLNVPEPEIAAGEYLWSRLVPGALIVLDDYNYSGYLEQRRAWNAFANRHSVDILPLPTGQGLIIKPPA
jgi:O-methyltransferase